MDIVRGKEAERPNYQVKDIRHQEKNVTENINLKR